MRCFRRPRTTQERRATGKKDILRIDAYGVRIRARRNSSNLPNTWDDVHRRDYRNRSWKRHRKTQYKEVNMDIGKQIV